jgi:hypothetical protein
MGEGLNVTEEASAGEGAVSAVEIGKVPCRVLKRSDVTIVCELLHALPPGNSVVKVRTLSKHCRLQQHDCSHQTDEVFAADSSSCCEGAYSWQGLCHRARRERLSCVEKHDP